LLSLPDWRIEDLRMYEPHTYATPQRKLTTGLPVGMVLLSMVATTASLLVGGEPELIPEIGRAA